MEGEHLGKNQMGRIFYGTKSFASIGWTSQRLSVGATIVKDNRIIAGGYNGSVAGEVHCIDEGCLIEDGHCIGTIMQK